MCQFMRGEAYWLTLQVFLASHTGEEPLTANLCSSPATDFSNVSMVCPGSKITCSVPGLTLTWIVSDNDGSNIIKTVTPLVEPESILGGSVQLEFISTADSPIQCITATACIKSIPDQQAMQGLKLVCGDVLNTLNSSTLVYIKG